MRRRSGGFCSRRPACHAEACEGEWATRERMWAALTLRIAKRLQVCGYSYGVGRVASICSGIASLVSVAACGRRTLKG